MSAHQIAISWHQTPTKAGSNNPRTRSRITRTKLNHFPCRLPQQPASLDIENRRRASPASHGWPSRTACWDVGTDCGGRVVDKFPDVRKGHNRTLQRTQLEPALILRAERIWLTMARLLSTRVLNSVAAVHASQPSIPCACLLQKEPHFHIALALCPHHRRAAPGDRVEVGARIKQRANDLRGAVL